MAQISVLKKVCDICGKERKSLEHSVKIGEAEFKEVCEFCKKRFDSLAERIKTPPKRKPRDPNAPKKAKAPKTESSSGVKLGPVQH